MTGTGVVTVVVILVVVIGIAGYVLGGWRAGATENDDSAPLSPRSRLTLMVYLLVFCATVIYIVGKLIFLDTSPTVG